MLLPATTRTPSATPLTQAAIGATMISMSGIWVALADTTPAAAGFYRCAVALPFLILLARRERIRAGAAGASRRQASMGVIAGLCFTLDLVLWHTAIGLIGAGLATVLGGTQIVIVPFASWLLFKERPSTRVVVAIPFLMGGIVVISGMLGNGTPTDGTALGALFGAGAGVAYSGFILAIRQANLAGTRAAGVLRDATATALIGTLTITLVAGEATSLVPTWPTVGWLVMLGLGSQVVAWLLISRSLPALPSAIGSVVLAVQPVMSLVMGIVLLGERPAAAQLAGVVLILGAAAHATGLTAVPRARGPRRAPVVPGPPSI